MNTIFEREIKDQNYTVMSNYHLRDKNISLKAKGLLSQLLSYSSDWNLTINGLCSVLKEQEKAVKNTIKELETNNYLTRTRLQDEKGRFYYKYIIHEKPKYPYPQNPPMDNPLVEKEGLINTNKEDKIDKGLYTSKIDNNSLIENNILLKYLIKNKFINKDDLELYKYDQLLREVLSEYNYNDIARINAYIVRAFISHKGKDENDNNIINKFGYYKESLLNNINRLNSIDDIEWFEDYES
jgi:hypothetical protein